MSSPQGRFASDAAALNGLVLDRVRACGKHPFCAFDRDEVVHGPANTLRRNEFDALWDTLVRMVKAASAQAGSSRPTPLPAARGPLATAPLSA